LIIPTYRRLIGRGCGVAKGDRRGDVVPQLKTT
jgi:hypothetical protein